MTWTDGRIALITRLWAEGVSASGIAETLGDVSRSAVLGKLHRLNLLRSRLPASAPRRYDLGAKASLPVAARPPAAKASVHAQTTPPKPPTLPRSPWREAAFATLNGTSPRPWLTRAFGDCSFPVGGEGEDLLSCCAPTQARSAYCATHHAIVFKPMTPGAKAAERRRWAA